MAERWDERERAYRRDEREYRNRDSGERDRTDRAADEVKSWFGDDAASQRRRMDEYRDASHDRDWKERGAHSAGRTWDRARETMADITDRDRDGRAASRNGTTPTGRRINLVTGAAATGRGDYWNRERSYRDAGTSGAPGAGSAQRAWPPRVYAR